VTDKRILQELGELVVEIIRERTRDGKGVKAPGANTTRLKPLSKKYIQWRSKFGGLSSETSPSTSNLTLTGEMLDSLSFDVRNGRLVVNVTGASNIKKAIYVSEERPFANLSKGEQTKLLKELERLMKAAVNKTI
jgi:hypothetical protein